MKAAIIAGCVVLACIFGWEASRVFYKDEARAAKFQAMLDLCISLSPDGTPDPNPRNTCLDRLKQIVFDNPECPSENILNPLNRL